MKTKKLITFILLFFVLLTSGLVHASGENEWDSELSYGGNVDVASRHVWRGQYQTQGVTWMPSIWAEFEGLKSSFWGRMPLENVANQGEFHCVANTTSFRYVVDEKFGIMPGFITYFYPYVAGWSTTGEAYLTLDYTVGDFTLATGHYFDVIDYQGAYYGDFSIAYNNAFTDVFTFSTKLTTGWGNAEYNNTYTGYNELASRFVGIEMSLKSQLSENLFVKPYVHYDVAPFSGMSNALGSRNVMSVGLCWYS